MAAGSPVPLEQEKLAVTFRFHRLLIKNLKAYSVSQNISQNEIAERAVVQYLTNLGVKVDQEPKISWE